MKFLPILLVLFFALPALADKRQLLFDDLSLEATCHYPTVNAYHTWSQCNIGNWMWKCVNDTPFLCDAGESTGLLAFPWALPANNFDDQLFISFAHDTTWPPFNAGDGQGLLCPPTHGVAGTSSFGVFWVCEEGVEEDCESPGSEPPGQTFGSMASVTGSQPTVSLGPQHLGIPNFAAVFKDMKDGKFSLIHGGSELCDPPSNQSVNQPVAFPLDVTTFVTGDVFHHETHYKFDANNSGGLVDSADFDTVFAALGSTDPDDVDAWDYDCTGDVSVGDLYGILATLGTDENSVPPYVTDPMGFPVCP